MEETEQPECQTLRGSTDALLSAVAGASSHDIMSRPAPGEWNAWEIAYHVFDIERWYVAKLCEAASADSAAALDRFMAVWAGLRVAAIEVACQIPPERLDQTGLLSGVPDWTPRTLLGAIAAHDLEHAAQIRAARAGGGEA